MKIVIIEDELLMANELESQLLKYDDSLEIVAKLASIEEATSYLEEHSAPDLFFSDIELTDGLSFAIFDAFPKLAPVIFCTAYDQYALNAFKAQGVDYLLKPVAFDDVAEAMEKFKSITQKEKKDPIDFNAISTLINNEITHKNKSILIYHGDKIIPLNVADIAIVETNDGATEATTFDKKTHTVNQTIASLNEKLGMEFFRVNRQFLINRKAILQAHQYFGRKLLIEPTVPFEKRLIVSKANAREFLNWLEAH